MNSRSGSFGNIKRHWKKPNSSPPHHSVRQAYQFPNPHSVGRFTHDVTSDDYIQGGPSVRLLRRIREEWKDRRRSADRTMGGRENAEVFQQVDELVPGEEYTFIGHLRVQSGELAFIGVRFPDGSEFISPQVTNQYTRDDQKNWRRCRVSFIVPEGVTSVEVFARRMSSAGGTVYADDFGLVLR